MRWSPVLAVDPALRAVMRDDLGADPDQGIAGLGIALKVGSNGFSEADEPMRYIVGGCTHGKAVACGRVPGGDGGTCMGGDVSDDLEEGFQR